MNKLTTEQKRMVEKNYDLIAIVIDSFSLDENEWYDVAALALVEAALEFKGMEFNFRKYATRKIGGSIRKELGKQAIESGKFIPLDSIIESSEQAHECYLSESIQYTDEEAVFRAEYSRVCANGLTSNQRAIIEMLAKGERLCDVARYFGCSYGTIRNAKAKFSKLRKNAGF
jgi:DNA-binding NarL/FixJ family response regulator